MPQSPNIRDTPSLILRTQSGLKWSYLSVIVQALLSLLILAILSRLLSPVDFGRIGITLIFVALAETISRLGIGPALVQRFDLTSRHIEAAFALSMMLGAGMVAVIWLIAPFAGSFFDDPVVPQILRTICVVFAITSLGNVSEYMLRRQLEFRNLAVADISSYSAGNGLTTIVMAFLDFGVWSLVWGMIVRHAMYTLIVVRYSPPPFRIRLTMPEAIVLLNRGAGFSLISMFNFVAQQSGPFVIGRWLGVAPLGYYTRAYSLITPALNFSFTLINVLFPAVSERQKQRERLRIIYFHGVEMLALVAIPAGVLVYASAPEIVVVVLGGQWDAVVPVLQILALAMPFIMCGAMDPPLVRGLGAVYQEMRRQVVFAVLIFIGSWIGSNWGLTGVVTAIVVAWISLYFLMARLALSLLGGSWRDLLRRYLPALWVGGWVALALWLSVPSLRDTTLPVIARLIIELLIWNFAAFAAIYFTPSFARPAFFDWMMVNVRFDSMGRPGYYLGKILTRLNRRWVSAAGSLSEV